MVGKVVNNFLSYEKLNKEHNLPNIGEAESYKSRRMLSNVYVNSHR